MRRLPGEPRPLPGHARPRPHYPPPRVEPAIEPVPMPPEPWPSIQFGDLTILLPPPPEKGPNDRADRL